MATSGPGTSAGLPSSYGRVSLRFLKVTRAMSFSLHPGQGIRNLREARGEEVKPPAVHWLQQYKSGASGPPKGSVDTVVCTIGGN
jgi:hypothetical protein